MEENEARKGQVIDGSVGHIHISTSNFGTWEDKTGFKPQSTCRVLEKTVYEAVYEECRN